MRNRSSIPQTKRRSGGQNPMNHSNSLSGMDDRFVCSSRSLAATHCSATLASVGKGPHMPSNDEVERRGVAPTTNEADLFQSSTLALTHRRHAPHSLEPIVR